MMRFASRTLMNSSASRLRSFKSTFGKPPAPQVGSMAKLSVRPVDDEVKAIYAKVRDEVEAKADLSRTPT